MQRTFMVTVTDSQVRSWRSQGRSIEWIARVTGMTTCEISRRIRSAYSRPAPGDPSPSEISAACDAIQREWSERERRRRYVGRNNEWRPTVVPVSVLALANS